MTTLRRPSSPLALVAVAALGLAAPAAVLAQGEMGPQPANTPPRQAQGQITLQGQVQSIRQVYLPQAPPSHTIVELVLDNGQRQYVDLGPQTDFESLGIQPGDSIAVSGNQRRIGRESALNAQTLHLEGQQITLRGGGPMGPRWSQPDPAVQPARQQQQQQPGQWYQDETTLQGRIDSIRQITLPGAPPQHTIAEIRFQDGRTELVNLGRQVNISRLGIQAGDQISLRGEEFFVGSEPVISVSTLSLNGRQLDIGWRDDQSPRRPGGFQQPGRAQQQQFQQVISNWPQISQEAARTTIQSYGPPDEFTSSMLIWQNNAPWTRTIIHADPVQHNFPIPHEDVLAQTVKMEVPPDMFSELAEFDGSLVADRTRGEVTANCDNEAMNFASLNLAYELVNGEIDVQQARQQLARIARAHQQGQLHPYTQGFQFNVPRGNTGDPDQPVQGGR